MNSTSNISQADSQLQQRLSQVEKLLGTDPLAANAAAAGILRDYPDEPMAGLFRGIALRLMGETAAAIELLRRVCERWPEAPLPQLQLGIALREADDLTGAIDAVSCAVAARPDFPDASYVLAELQIEKGDKAAADEAFATYIQYSANDPVLRQADALLRDNRLDEVERILNEHLERHRVDVVALSMLADVAERRDRLDEADALLRDCLELSPSFLRAQHNHAVVLLRQNKAEEALEKTDLLLAREPRNPEVRKLRAAVLVRLLEYEESIQICEELLEDDSNQPQIWTSLGHMLKSVGRREECVSAYKKAIELAPGYGEPYWSLANLKTHRMNDAELESMLAELGKPTLRDVDRIHMNFATGKALEDRQDYEASFRHYEKANRLRLQKKPYHYEELMDHVARSKALFTAEFFAGRQGHGSVASAPVFILGLPRSGSTLVEQILASHSAVEGTMELPHIAGIAKSLDQMQLASGDAGYLTALASLNQDQLREIGDAYVEKTRVHRKLGRAYFIDKMPNNYAHIGLIHLMLPNARIIDVRRHPLACGLSLFKEHFADAQNFAYSLENIGRYYRSYVELMTHFDAVLPGRVHRVIYESLVENTESEVRRLLDYCDLPFEDSCLTFYENQRAVNTASSEQVRRPIYREGLQHWRHYEPWLEPLKAELGPLVDSYAAAE